MTEQRQPLPPFLRRIRESSSRGAESEEAERAAASRPLVGEAQAAGGSAREGLRRALAGIGERVDEIIAEADRMAEQIRREAQADAERYLEERRRQADAYEAEGRRRIDAGVAALRSGLSRITAETGRVVSSVEAAIAEAEDAGAPADADPPGGASDAMPPPATPAGTVAYSGRESPSEPAGATEERVSMLIRAGQLAVQGSEREEIERALQSEFSGADTAGVVDEILGTR